MTPVCTSRMTAQNPGEKIFCVSVSLFLDGLLVMLRGWQRSVSTGLIISLCESIHNYSTSDATVSVQYFF